MKAVRLTRISTLWCVLVLVGGCFSMKPEVRLAPYEGLPAAAEQQTHLRASVPDGLVPEIALLVTIGRDLGGAKANAPRMPKVELSGKSVEEMSAAAQRKLAATSGFRVVSDQSLATELGLLAVTKCDRPECLLDTARDRISDAAIRAALVQRGYTHVVFLDAHVVRGERTFGLTNLAVVTGRDYHFSLSSFVYCLDDGSVCARERVTAEASSAAIPPALWLTIDVDEHFRAMSEQVAQEIGKQFAAAFSVR